MKRAHLLLAALALCLVLTILPTQAHAASCQTHDYVDGFCTVCGNYKSAPLKDGYYEIYTAGQLYWFAKQVASGNNEINGKLTADITVNPDVLTATGELNGDGSALRTWTPIGTYVNKYMGTFDGNGKTVSGLYIDDSTAEYAGLFGEVGAAGTVKDVTVTDSYFRILVSAKADIYMAGIVGCNGGAITDCRNESTVIGNEGYVGGIAGSGNGTIKGCENLGNIQHTGSQCGGIIGDNHGKVIDCTNKGVINGHSTTGGIVGMNGMGTVTDCINLGEVNGNGSTGGIAGLILGEPIDHCHNAGPVSGTTDVGGIVGRINSADTVIGCYNTGTVTGTERIGGIIGLHEGGLQNCFSTGAVIGDQQVGGIVGYLMDGSFSQCYYLSDTAPCDVGNATTPSTTYARNAQQFASGLVAWQLNGGTTDGTQTYYQDLGTDDVPGFSGGTVYQATAPCVTFSNKSGSVTAKDHSGTAASCANGVTCPDCGDLIGHSYETTVTAPTCQTVGFTTYVCATCGDSYTDDFTPTAPHSYENGSCTACGMYAAPQILSCYSTKQTSVKITWTLMEGAAGYELYRTTDSRGINWTKVKTIDNGSTDRYTNQGLKVGVTYYYQVRAYYIAADGTKTYSAYSDMDYMPAAVTWDGPYSNATFRIRLRWDEVDGSHGYQIWRQEADGTWRVVKTIGDKDNVLTSNKGSITAYSNTGLTAGSTYTYKMRAFMITEDGRKVFGTWSDEITVAVMPETPTLTVTSPKAGRAKLTWNALGGAAGYQIWMSESPDSDFKIVKSITDSSTSYTKYDLESGKTYYFKIRAYVEVDGKKTFGAFTQVIAITVK